MIVYIDGEPKDVQTTPPGPTREQAERLMRPEGYLENRPRFQMTKEQMDAINAALERNRRKRWDELTPEEQETIRQKRRERKQRMAEKAKRQREKKEKRKKEMKKLMKALTPKPLRKKYHSKPIHREDPGKKK